MRCVAAVSLVALLLAGWVHGVTSGRANVQEAAALTKEGVEFFEKHIRPILVERCYECHSAQAPKVKGKLLLDTQPGMARGGAGGPILVPGDVQKSRLIHALRWTDPDLAMPPKAKLTPQQIERFEQWIQMGAPDPRGAVASELPKKATTPSMDAGRAWWAFRPVTQTTAPAV